MENLIHEPSEKQNLRTERLISQKCLMYKPKCIPERLNVLKEPLPILRLMNLLLGHQLNSSLFVFLAHKMAHTKPSMDCPVACHSLCALKCNSFVTPE